MGDSTGTRPDEKGIIDKDLTFDLERSTEWLLVSDRIDVERLLSSTFIILGLCWIILNLPILFYWNRWDQTAETIEFLTIWFGLPSLMIIVSYLVVRRKRISTLRMDRSGIQAIDNASSGWLRKKTISVPLERILDIELKRDGYPDFEILYINEAGEEDTLTFSSSDRYWDILGFLEALKEVSPNDNLPTVDELLAKQGLGTDEESVSYQFDPRGNYEPFVFWLVFPILYFSLYGAALMMVGFRYLLTDPLILFSAFFFGLFLYLSECVLLISMFDGHIDNFLDALECKMTVEEDRISVPRPLVPRLFLSIRDSIQLNEIQEARLHLDMHTMTWLSIIETVRGRAFLVHPRNFFTLERQNGFRRNGRRMVNTRAFANGTSQVAYYDWTKVRLFLIFPAFLFILIDIIIRLS